MIRDFMVPKEDVAMCKPSHTLETVALRMRDSKIGCVVVDSAEPNEGTKPNYIAQVSQKIYPTEFTTIS